MPHGVHVGFGEVLGFLAGLATTGLLGMLVPVIIRLQVPSASTPPRGLTKERWGAVTHIGADLQKPVRLLGLLERVLFFVCFWLGAWELAAAWLAFKLASKWQSWSSIVKVPEAAPDGVDQLDYLSAKNVWASQVLQRWLIGVLLNILVAFAGLAVGVGVGRAIT